MVLTSEQLLCVLDQGDGTTGAERGVWLWRTTDPGTSLESLWGAPVGCLAHAMLDLREAMLGPQLELHDRCPRCDEEIEFTVSIPEIRLAQPPMDNPPFDVEIDGQPVTLRRVSCDDLRRVERGEITDRAGVIARCVSQGLEGLDEAGHGSIDAILGERDPQADVTFSLACPACADSWEGVFDPCEVLWTELRARAKQLLFDVDALARAYGWSEAEVLKLSPPRRRAYLELLDR